MRYFNPKIPRAHAIFLPCDNFRDFSAAEKLSRYAWMYIHELRKNRYGAANLQFMHFKNEFSKITYCGISNHIILNYSDMIYFILA